MAEIAKIRIGNEEQPYDIKDANARDDVLELYRANNVTTSRKDLAYTFADEVAEYEGNAWAWLKARLNSNNFSDICIGDIMRVDTTYEISPGNTFYFGARVVGINTYRGFNRTVKNHIDFCSARCFPVPHRYNMIDTNNGNALQGVNWLASDLYLWLNSLSGSISSDFEGGTQAVDYTSDGVYYYLPENLKNAITPKEAVLSYRYSESGYLSDDSNFGTGYMGKLWLPTENEVFGIPVMGGKTQNTLKNAIQYPWFTSVYNRAKYVGNSGGKTASWWLSTASTNSDKNKWCNVSWSGEPTHADATTAYSVPVCFRIMAD